MTINDVAVLLRKRTCAADYSDDHEALCSAADLVEQLAAALTLLKTGTCWCQMGIGNPMIRNHSEACVNIQKILGLYCR